MKRKGIFVGGLLLAFTIIVDVLTSIKANHSEALSRIENHIDRQFDDAFFTLTEGNFLKSLSATQNSLTELKQVKHMTEILTDKSISANVEVKGKSIFWVQPTRSRDTCRSRVYMDHRIDVCLNLTDESGLLNKDITESLNLGYTYAVKKGADSFESRPMKIIPQKTFRSTYLNSILVASYILIFLFLAIFVASALAPVAYLSIIGLRAGLYLVDWARRFHPLEVVNPEYGFSPLNPSIADFMLNAILLFGVGLVSFKFPFNRLEKWVPRQAIFAGGIAALVTLFIFHMRMIQDLVFRTSLYFNFEDLTQLNTLDYFAMGATVVMGMALIVFAHSVFVHKPKIRENKHLIYLAYLIFSISGAYLGEAMSLNIPVLVLAAFLLIFCLLSDIYHDIQTKNLTWIIWWAILLSGYIASVFFYYDIQNENVHRLQFLKSTFHQPDEGIADSLMDARRMKNIQKLVDAIGTLPDEARYSPSDILNYFREQTGEAIVRLQIFNSRGENQLTKSDLINEREFQRMYSLQLANALFFNEIENVYWQGFKSTSGSTFLLGLQPGGKTMPARSYDFEYVSHGRLIKSSPFITNADLEYVRRFDKNEGILYNKGTGYIFFRPAPGKLLVSKKVFAGLIKPIALFSLIFSFIGLLVLMLSLSNHFLGYLPQTLPLRFRNINSLSLRIQIVIIILTILSFIAIAWVTSTFLKQYVENEKQVMLTDKIRSITHDMNEALTGIFQANEALQILQAGEEKFEDIHNIDLQVYSQDGLLIDDGYPNNNKKLGLFPYMYFNKTGFRQPFTDEKDPENLVSYIPIRLAGEKAPIIVQVTNHDGAISKRLSIFDFLGSILNVYVFLFLIASAISIIVARSITNPLTLLANKLVQLNFGKRNELIDWKRYDEIGVLIDNYNNMVTKLEQSAHVLAKTERDMAWREMAKQVAHEIKNPLTPMKLSIQYLEKAIESQPDKAIPLVKRISETLIEQIDNLTEIANAFSNFAKLPQASNVQISLNEVVEAVHDLFRKRTDMDIRMTEPIDELYVYADKNHLIRVLNNIIKNAVEAIPDDRRGQINIALTKNGRNAVISIRDNGIGIPDDMRSKVFTPNFTTKNSGTGLGLAIAANMIESFNGKIHFKTIPDKGTEFFVEIPIIKPTQFSAEKERISLD